MKNFLLLFSLAILAGSFSSCKKYKEKEVYANVPVYMDYDSFRSSVSFEAPAQMENPGNIYLYNNYIFVCEEDKGIHFIDNSDPAYPFSIGFLKVHGVTQMAAQGNYLYVNSFMDLVVIDISTIQDPKEASRLFDVFTYTTPATDDQYPVANVYADKGVVVDWEIEKTDDVSGFMNKYFVSDCENCDQKEVKVKTKSAIRVNLAGSRSKFAIIENHLYVIDDNYIKSFNLSNAILPSFGAKRRVWAEAETLFPEGDHLFVGTTTGMLIYNTGENRALPELDSEIEHLESCDPVVVQGDYAYITLRTGSDCGGDINELQVIDVSNRKNPKFKDDFEMTNPHGLAVDGDLLFICDGEDGLKIFDNSDPLECGNNIRYQFHNITASDVILNNGIAVMISEQGVFQYNYSNPSNIYMISMLYF